MTAITLPGAWPGSRAIRRLMDAGWWAGMWGLSGLIIVNSVPYYSLAPHFAFLVEKGALASDPSWRLSFFAHISGGMVCLAIGPLLFSRWLVRRVPGMHRWIGRLYALAVLGWAGPSGFHLSFFAKGEALGRFCFVLQAVGWWATTALGVKAILERRVPDHLRWMIRSYALALSAVFFRVSQVALHYGIGMNDDLNYSVSLWASLAASLVAGEWMIARRGLGPRPTLNGGVA